MSAFERQGRFWQLFVVQFPITSTAGRLVLCSLYGALAVLGLIVNRRHVMATLRAPFVSMEPIPAEYPSAGSGALDTRQVRAS